MRIQENLEKSKYEADGKISIQGTTIPYHTICEDHFFVDEEYNPVASIFSYAYFRSDIQDNSKRPILFIYNGGPGCASLWLHMGLFGPRIVKLDDELNLPTVPPFELEDNPHCLLDLCDLVFIDPVGTGLGRLIQEKARKEFYETHGDVRSVSKFIEQFLARYNRRNSPVLLAGESYGTARSALLAGELMGAGPEKADTMGISVSGIFLLGSYFIEKLPVEASATDLITMAATNYFHNPKENISQKDFIDEAFTFASTEYVTALFLGDACPNKEEIADKLAYYSGIDKTYWLRHHLHMDMQKGFAHKLLEDKGLALGFYDGRYTWNDDPEIMEANVIADDPAMGQYTPAFQTAYGLMRQELNITSDRISKGLVFDVNMTWNREFKTSPAQSLAGCMRRNKQMKVFFASGLYDLCTTAGNARYLATHSNLDQNRVTIGEYPSGHMAYLGKESFDLLAKDMRAFFESCI